MVKHTQTIHRLLPTNCLNVFNHFVGLALKGLNDITVENIKPYPIIDLTGTYTCNASKVIANFGTNFKESIHHLRDLKVPKLQSADTNTYYEDVSYDVESFFTSIAVAETIDYILKRIPAGNYMFKFSNRNTRTKCEICSKLTIKTPERRQASFWCLYC